MIESEVLLLIVVVAISSILAMAYADRNLWKDDDYV